MKIARVTTNGRVTIPAGLRKKYGLYSGRKVKFEIADNGLHIIPLASAQEIKTHVGSVGLKKKMLASLMKEQKREQQL